MKDDDRKIYASKVDPFTVKLSFEKVDLWRELYKFFSQYPKNFVFMKNYKNGYWDGKIRYYDQVKSTLPIGLLEDLKCFCEAFDFELVVEPEVLSRNLAGMSVEEIKALLRKEVSSIVVDPRFKPRQYQLKYFLKFMDAESLLMESPTASGKSLVIYMCVRHAMTKIRSGKKILIIVPTIQLVEQMFKDFKDYGFDSESNCARIYSETKESVFKLETEKKIIISTWQSLYKLSKDRFKDVEMFVGDEIHEFSATKARSVLTNCRNVRFKLGTTGTFKHSDLASLWTIKGMFGPIVKFVDTMELVQAGHISPFVVRVLNLIYPESRCKTAKGLTYNEEMDYVATFEDKTRFVVDLVERLSSEGENTLLLFKRISYGKKLKETIDSKLGIDSFYVDGSIDVSDREEVRESMERSRAKVAVCSYGTFARGIDIKNLKNLVFVDSTKSEIRLIQSIGRVLRKHKDKGVAVVWDVVDNLQTKGNVNYSLRHFFERKSIYDANKFEVSYEDVEMKDEKIS